MQASNLVGRLFSQFAPLRVITYDLQTNMCTMKQNFLSWHVNEHIERISQNLRVTMDATLGYIKLAGN